MANKIIKSRHDNNFWQWKSGNKFHRLDGPAVIYDTGWQGWFRHGKLHRVDGPAVIDDNGNATWWLNNSRYTFENYCKNVKLSDEDLVILKLKYDG